MPTLIPFSWYSSRVIQKFSRSFMISANTAPPKNTMCLRRGGSSIRILNFYILKSTAMTMFYSRQKLAVLSRTHRQLFSVSFKHTLQVKLLYLPLKPRRQSRVHGWTTRQHNVLVEFWTCINVSSLNKRAHPMDSSVFIIMYCSDTWMVLNSNSATPTPSMPIRCGWNRASGASKRSPPTLTTRPSGNYKQKLMTIHTVYNELSTKLYPARVTRLTTCAWYELGNALD